MKFFTLTVTGNGAKRLNILSLGTKRPDIGKMMKIMPQYCHIHGSTNLPEVILRTYTASNKATEK